MKATTTGLAALLVGLALLATPAAAQGEDDPFADPFAEDENPFEEGDQAPLDDYERAASEAANTTLEDDDQAEEPSQPPPDTESEEEKDAPGPALALVLVAVLAAAGRRR